MMDESQAVPRRQGDVVLEQVRGELAVLSKAVELGTKATDNAIATLSQSIRGLENKIDTVLEAQADPAASAGGRQVLEKIADVERVQEDHHARIKALEGFTTEARGAYRALRAQMTIIGFVLGLLSGIAAVLSLLHSPAV
jgi:hypothetical protein